MQPGTTAGEGLARAVLADLPVAAEVQPRDAVRPGPTAAGQCGGQQEAGKERGRFRGDSKVHGVGSCVTAGGVPGADILAVCNQS